MERRLALAFAIVCSLLPGCGGGGGGADRAVDVFTPNPAPTFTVGVAFLADAEVDERVEFYVADLDGDGSLKVSGPLVAGGDVHSFQWSPDRALLAFLADKDADDVIELYVVAAGGGQVTKASRPLVAGESLADFQWSPESTRLAYRLHQAPGIELELFSVPAHGGPSVSATGMLPKDAAVQSYGWAPDSSRVAYVANHKENHRGEVFVAAPDGTGNAKLFDGAYEGYFPFGLAWAPDGAHLAGLGNVLGSFADGSLFVAPAGGPAVGPSSAAGTLPLWSPDSSLVAFTGDGVHVSPLALFGSPQIGPEVSSLAPGETQRRETLTWAPDGARIAFLTQDLHVSFPTTSYGAERVTPHLHGTDRRVEKFQWTPDPWGIVFTADIAAAGVIEMFVSPRDAASLVTVSQPLVFGGQVLDFEVR